MIEKVLARQHLGWRLEMCSKVAACAFAMGMVIAARVFAQEPSLRRKRQAKIKKTEPVRVLSHQFRPLICKGCGPRSSEVPLRHLPPKIRSEERRVGKAGGAGWSWTV